MFIRFLLFLIFWLLLDGGKLFGLVIGLPAAGLAAWFSLRLLPPSRAKLRPGALLSLGWHFIGSSVLAGGKVSRRSSTLVVHLISR